MLALQGGNFSIEDLLKTKDVDTQFLLNEAARHNLVEKMAVLIGQHGADVNGISHHINSDNCQIYETPLLAAAVGNSVAAVDWLLDHGANVEGQQEFDGDSIKALWYAAQYGNVRMAQLLLVAGADVKTAKKSTNYSALMIAVQNGHKAMVAVLLRNGVDLNQAAHNGGAPLMMAISSARIALVAQLVNAGVNIPLIMGARMIAQMRKTKFTATPGYVRKVSDEEMDVMYEVINVNSDLKHNDEYRKARVAERKGKFRKALRLLQAVPSSCASAQLKFDTERNIEAIYGVKGSDARISIWSQVPVMSEVQPRDLQFSAWTQVGRKIYIHGGFNFIKQDLSHQFPTIDELWTFDIDTRKYCLLGTTGKTPGPRSGHTMFAFKSALYLWGGNSSTGIFDSKLYRFKLDNNSSGAWELVKTKGSLRPPAREDHAGVLYKGIYYITGGELGSEDLTDDMWCLNMSSLKWSSLKRIANDRKSHKMWAANNKIYHLGGRTRDNTIENPMFAWHGLDDFCSFDLESKSWSSVKIIGDQPFHISEYTVAAKKIRINPRLL